MCGGHHGVESRSSYCCCGGGHAQRGCGCGCHSQCGCGGGGGHRFRFQRRFRSRDDEVAELEEYLKDLEAEAKGVRERLAEIGATSERA